jgi:Sec-independent protein translocase protein TatA
MGEAVLVVGVVLVVLMTAAKLEDPVKNLVRRLRRRRK